MNIGSIPGNIDRYPAIMEPISVYPELEVDPVFANNSWRIIKQVSTEYIAKQGMIAQEIFEKYGWQLGDLKPYVISGQTINAQIMDFNHDIKTVGGNAGISFFSKDILNATMSMNTTATNSGGYDVSYLRDKLNTEVFNSLETDLQKVIVSVKKLTANGGNQSNISIIPSSDKLWIISLTELNGANDGAFSHIGEGFQYAYWVGRPYSDYKRNNQANNSYWTRSPYPSSPYVFTNISNIGQIKINIYANDSTVGVVLGFCI